MRRLQRYRASRGASTMGGPSWWSFRPSQTFGRPPAGSTRRTPAPEAVTATLCTCGPSPSQPPLFYPNVLSVWLSAGLFMQAEMFGHCSLTHLWLDLSTAAHLHSKPATSYGTAPHSCMKKASVCLSRPYSMLGCCCISSSCALCTPGACGRTCSGGTRRRTAAARARAARSATTGPAAGEALVTTM